MGFISDKNFYYFVSLDFLIRTTRIKFCKNYKSVCKLHSRLEYEFLLTASGQIKHELLKMNDAKFIGIVHWRYTEVAKQAAKIVTLNKAFTNCFKIIHKLSKQIFNIILATKFSR